MATIKRKYEPAPIKKRMTTFKAKEKKGMDLVKSKVTSSLKKAREIATSEKTKKTVSNVASGIGGFLRNWGEAASKMHNQGGVISPEKKAKKRKDSKTKRGKR